MKTLHDPQGDAVEADGRSVDDLCGRVRLLERRVRRMQQFAAVLGLLAGVMAFAGFAAPPQKKQFAEIDVERINVVEGNGQVKLVIANKERLPGPGNVVSGKFYTRAGVRTPGILFYNEKGDECGGLVYGSLERGGKYGAGAGLTLDRYGGDQVIGVQYQDDNGNRAVGFNVWDQPDVSLEEQRRNFEAARKMKDGPERDALRQQAVANQRVFMGRTSDKHARITLSDANGRPRLRLSVGPDGEPKIEFLDATGKITQSLPASPK